MKRARNIAIILALAAAALSAASYALVTRVTALMAVRFAVREAGIPVNVSGARWEWRLADLRAGIIKLISFTGDVASRLRFDIETPVEVRKDGATWEVSLTPRLRLGIDAGGSPLAFPELAGTAVFRIEPKKGFTARFDLKSTGPYEMQRAEGGLAVKSIRLDGDADIHGKALVANGRLHAEGLQALWGSRFLEKPNLRVETRIDADLGQDPVVARFSKFILRDPWRASGAFTVGGGPVSGDIAGFLDAAGALADAASVAPETADALRDAAAKGRLTYSVKMRGGGVTGSIGADLASVELPAKNIKLRGVKLRHVLGGRGTLDVAAAELGPFALTQATRLNIDQGARALAVTSTKPLLFNGLGPLRGAELSSAFVNAKIPTGPGAVSASANLSGVIPIAGLQQAFCLVADRLLPGSIRLAYDRITLDDGVVEAKGRAEGPLFGGWARVGDTRLTSKGHTELEAEAFLENADLKFLAEWLRFGKVTGRLDIALKNAAFVLGALGTIPVRYDFSVRGSSDKGRGLNFSSQALANLMDMMGVDTPVLNMQMGARKVFSDVFGFINDIDYFGFHARTQLGYTTLETFDPADSKNHYLIHGTSFKMPLKSSMGEGGTYPVVMKTESFQTWLWSRVTWFRNRSKEQSDEKNPEKHNECRPIL